MSTRTRPPAATAIRVGREATGRMGASTTPESASSAPPHRREVPAPHGPRRKLGRERPVASPACGRPPSARRCPCRGGARCRAGRARTPPGLGSSPRTRGNGTAAPTQACPSRWAASVAHDPAAACRRLSRPRPRTRPKGPPGVRGGLTEPTPSRAEPSRSRAPPVRSTAAPGQTTRPPTPPPDATSLATSARVHPLTSAAPGRHARRERGGNLDLRAHRGSRRRGTPRLGTCPRSTFVWSARHRRLNGEHEAQPQTTARRRG